MKNHKCFRYITLILLIKKKLIHMEKKLITLIKVCSLRTKKILLILSTGKKLQEKCQSYHAQSFQEEVSIVIPRLIQGSSKILALN